MKKRFLLVFLISGLVVFNGCQREYSLENGNGASEGTLKDDGAGDCLPKTVAGAYVVGTSLGATNYIDVQVNVTKAGNYIIFTDTVNGMHFRGSGVFSTTGLNTVRLNGNGTPAAIGISNFVVNYGTSGCTIAVNVVGSLAVFTLGGAPGGCLGAAVAGTYTSGVALTSSNNVTINVNVTTVGAYNIVTIVSNGMIFTGSGTFSTTGAQQIVLTGTGTPTSAGNTNVPVTVGSSQCSFTVTVGAAAGAATFTMNCPSVTANGTYTVGTALAATNTVTMTVTVTTIGTYSITGTLNGMTFSSAAGASFAATGSQTVTLTGSGNPTTAGANTVSLTGGTAPCNVTVNVNPGAGGAAVYTITCASAVANGTYTVGTALTAANTITLSVTVTTSGTYSITGTINGMTFSSAAGASFAATGAQTVTLTGTGSPTTQGTNTVPLTGGTAPCNALVTVSPAAGGAAVFTINCATAIVNGTYTQNVALSASNTIALSVTVTTAGTYTAISTTAANGMTFSKAAGTLAAGAQTITLTGSGTPNASGMVYIPVTAGSTPCNVLIFVGAPASASDYFPRTTNSIWSYEIDDDMSDSVIRKVIAPTFTALGNTYNIFFLNDGTGFDSSGYYRRNGADYFEYLDVGGFIGFDNPLRAEYIMLKDNMPVGNNWKSAGFSGAVTGSPIQIRFSYTILQKDVTISLTTSTGPVTYQNVIVVEEKYEAFISGAWTDITSAIDFYGKSYYARNVGLIKYEALDASNVVQASQELRRWVVY